VVTAGAFADHLRNGVRDALSQPAPAGVYALSLFLQDDEQDPARPTLVVGWNTETRVTYALNAPREQWPNPWWHPCDEAEARWNYAFWLQNELTVIAGDDDPDGRRLRVAWIAEHALRDDDPDAYYKPGISRAFATLCAAAGRRLHDDGTITTLFGAPLPVLVHELEYYPPIADLTAAANPPGLADDFLAWMNDFS
jgi:hypothetical protein